VSLPGPFSNLSALFDVSIRSLEVIFDYAADNVNQEGPECKTHIQVIDKEDDDSVVHKRIVDCTKNKFTFHEVRYGGNKGDSLLVCVWQEIDDVQTSEKQCTHAMQKPSSKQNNVTLMKQMRSIAIR
jgi:hypothetical protein